MIPYEAMIPDRLREAYSAAVVTDDNGNALAGACSLPFPLFVITACNPWSRPTEAMNEGLHSRLQAFLACHFPQAQWREALGGSRDGQWKEKSLAVSGLSEAEAVAVGRHFQQWAIFRLDEHGLAVVSCCDSEQAATVAKVRLESVSRSG